MITSVVRYFVGSTADDFEPDTTKSPFNPCPKTPNCAIHAVKYPIDGHALFEAAVKAIENFSPFHTDADSESLQINAVFRIRVFGFKDDVNIMIQSNHSGESILHIKSASRVGRSDLGVNRRRIKRILSEVNQHL